MSPLEAPVGWLLLSVSLAVGVVLAARRLRKTPAVEAIPQACDAAVETPVEEAAAPPVAAASSGAPTDWDRHVDDALAVTNRRTPQVIRPWVCLPCQRVYVISDAEAHAHAQLHQHADDFTAWEQELTP